MGVVLDACFVIAGNQSEELHLFTPPQVPVAGDDSDPDGLLVPGTYHFVVIQQEGMAVSTFSVFRILSL